MKNSFLWRCHGLLGLSFVGFLGWSFVMFMGWLFVMVLGSIPILLINIICNHYYWTLYSAYLVMLGVLGFIKSFMAISSAKSMELIIDLWSILMMSSLHLSSCNLLAEYITSFECSRVIIILWMSEWFFNWILFNSSI